MSEFFYQKKTQLPRKLLSSFVALAFSLSLILGPAGGANAQYISNLPAPGQMVLLSPAFQPPVLKGMTLHPENPLQFDFIVDRGQDNLSGDALKNETQKLLKYFLAAMTIPDDDSWVNLSPYEGDRIIPDMLGSTDMGKQMLEQDYLLKQLSASLTNPQEEIGKKFWDTVYKKAYEKFGTTTIPINTFNKVWIVPDRALILEEDGYVFIGESHLKVMLDEDYTSLKENLKSEKFGTKGVAQDKVEALSEVSSQVVREIILPELEKEINQGKNFAAVRQIYHSVILATWYKQNLKNSLLGRIYVDKSKIGGVNIGEKDLKQKVYEQYLAAFRKGVYNLIKEDYDLASKETLPRKYFSGGLAWKEVKVTRAQGTAANSIVADMRNKLSKDPGRYIVSYARMTEGEETPVVAQVASAAVANGVGKPKGYKNILKSVMSERDLDPASQNYFSSLVRAFFLPTDDQQPLIIKIPGLEYGNFKPSALLTPQERKDLLGQITYTELLTEITPTSGQYVYDVVMSSLDAGLGTNVGRQDFVEKKVGRARIGAKGTDLGIEGIKPRGILNIAEIKMLRLIKEIESGVYPVQAGGQITFQPIVSVDSKPSYDALFDQPYFNSSGEQLTYRQKLERLGVVIRPRIVPFYPGLSTENGNYPTWDRESSGSHGEVGFKIFLETLGMTIQDKPLFNVFCNGDGVNNMADHNMLDWMAKNNVPIVMVSTAKIPLDKKGGQIGLEFLPDGNVHVKMLELKSAQNNQQGLEFERVGLAGGIGEPGQQDFNTNVAIINQALLAKILQEVLRDVFNGDVSKMQQIFTPDLIASEKPNEKGEMFIQLEGPIGTVLTNVHNFFASNNDPRVQGILRKYKVDRMLRIVHVEANNRTKVFTPIKSALDFVLQMYSDYYRLNQDIWMLEDARTGSTLPVINLVGSNPKDKYYDDVSHLMDTFGRFSVANLKELAVHGRVLMQNAVFEGKVSIDNKMGQIVDLSIFKDSIGTTSDGRLLFKDIAIEITEDGDLVKKTIASSSLKEVDIEVVGEGDEILSVKPRASSSVGQAAVLVVGTRVETAVLGKGLEKSGYKVFVAPVDGLDGTFAQLEESGVNLDLIIVNDESVLAGLPNNSAVKFVGQSPDATVADRKTQTDRLREQGINTYVKGPANVGELLNKVQESVLPNEQVLVENGETTLRIGDVSKLDGFRFVMVIDEVRTEVELNVPVKDASGTEVVEMGLFDGEHVGNFSFSRGKNETAFVKAGEQGQTAKDFRFIAEMDTRNNLKIRPFPATPFTNAKVVYAASSTIDENLESGEYITVRVEDYEALYPMMDVTGPKGSVYTIEFSTIIEPTTGRKDISIRTVRQNGESVFNGANQPRGTPYRNEYFNIEILAPVGGQSDLVQVLAKRAIRVKWDGEPKNILNNTDVVGLVPASTDANVGGIDFDPSLLNLQIKRNGRGVPLPLPQQDLEKINIDGLYPVIINMQPATIQNFPFLISAENKEKVPELSMR